MEVEEKMAAIKSKTSPTYTDVRRYVRYLINVLKHDPDSIYENVSHWKKEDVDKAVKDVERENLKPKPKRYYVSLKEPLEDPRLK